jgi:hypothetical protein
MTYGSIGLSLLWGSFKVFNQTHYCWHLWQKGMLYTDKEKLSQLAAGYSLDFFLGEFQALRAAGHALRITTSSIEAVEQKIELERKWENFKQACKGKELELVCCRFQKGTFFSSHIINYVNYHGKRATLRVYYVAIAVLELGKEAFILSMRVCDAKEALRMETREGVHEIFINAEKLVKRAAERRELVHEALQKNKKIMDLLLHSSYLPITSDSLIGWIDQGMGLLVGVNETMSGNEPDSFFGKFYTSFFTTGQKNVVHINCDKLAPPEPRFPPDEIFESGYKPKAREGQIGKIFRALSQTVA